MAGPPLPATVGAELAARKRRHPAMVVGQPTPAAARLAWPRGLAVPEAVPLATVVEHERLSLARLVLAPRATDFGARQIQWSKSRARSHRDWDGHPIRDWVPLTLSHPGNVQTWRPNSSKAVDLRRTALQRLCIRVV